ncbi:MAG: hypothetical protein ABIP48_32335 [Planctomycetota bacterium]
MQDKPPLSADTIARMAEELLATPVGRRHLEAVAALLAGLTSEMAAMRAMEIGNVEPATVYDASER